MRNKVEAKTENGFSQVNCKMTFQSTTDHTGRISKECYFLSIILMATYTCEPIYLYG